MAAPVHRDHNPARRNGMLANVLLSLLLASAGWVSLQWRELLWPRFRGEEVDWNEMGLDPLQQFSFDVPFVVRHSLGIGWGGQARLHALNEVVLLYMDEESTRRLELSPLEPWSRAVHARLVDHLTNEGARAVVFDAVFDTDSGDDELLAAALARHGRVFLGAAFDSRQSGALGTSDGAGGLAAEQLTRRNPLLYRAARGWGLLTFRPVDGDHGVRRIFMGKRRDGLPSWPSLSWRVARDLGARLPGDAGAAGEQRWLNYYGPAQRLEGLSYHRALFADGGVPEGFFRDKIVVIGARGQLAATAGRLLDEFSTPWSRFRGRAYTPGVEIHATAILNLLNGEWLTRLCTGWEQTLVVLLGLALGALRWLKPWRATLIAALLAALCFGISCLMHWQALVWWNWTVPVLIQIPAAVVLAVSSRYYLEERRKRKLRAAFGFYLSPDLAEEIADRDFPLTPGGEKVVATLVFTDLEGFTTLSEKLGDAAELGRVLTDYFTRTTGQILEEKGTVIKFIGDAVFAAWNAPLPQPDHAERAVRAAWRLSQVSEMDVPIARPDGSTETVHVRTRIGIHTGEALAGNLGSARRFDYTLIGDAVNFAARLEGANKYTGTTILLSEDTVQQVAGKFLVRRLGAFKVKGKSKAISIYELLGEDPAARPGWLDVFDAALAAWGRGDLEEAAAGFNAVKQGRGGTDGPSQFYLDRIETFHQGRRQAMTLAPIWSGEVDLDGK